MKAIQFNGKTAIYGFLNGDIIWQSFHPDYYIEYTIDNTSSYKLNESPSPSSNYRYCLPRIYSDAEKFSFNYSRVEITLLNGNTTTNLSTPCSDIARVKLWYPEDTVAVKFAGTLSITTEITSLLYIKTDNFTDMSGMFTYTKLSSLDLSTWNTSNVTNMEDMFLGSKSLAAINLSNFNTSKVTNMSGMFASCDALASLDLSSFDTSNVTNMYYMFANCDILASLDLSSFDTSKVTNMGDMFRGISQYIDWNYDRNDSDSYAKWTLLESETGYTGMFPWNIIFNPDYYIEYTVDNTSGFNLNDGITSGSTTYSYCLPRVYSTSTEYTYSYANIEITLLDNTITTDLVTPCNNISKVKLWYPEDTVAVKFVGYDAGSYAARISELIYIKTDNFTDMNSMFYHCPSLTRVDLSSFVTSNIENMGSMFNGCTSLLSLDLSNFNTSKVTNMSYMFYYCSSLTSLDLSSFNTSKVFSMNHMFYNCSSLTSLDLSSFDTSSVTDASGMFGLVPPDTLDFNYDKNDTSSYANWTLTEDQASFLGTFPWNVKSPYYIEYTLSYGSSKALNGGTGTEGTVNEYKYGLPRIYHGTNARDFTYPTSDMVEITLNDDNGTITNDLSTLCGNVDKIKVWYPEDTIAVKFEGNSTVKPEVREVLYAKTDNFTDMSMMFYYCNSLLKIETSSWDTSKVTNMSYMFADCNSLYSIDMANINTISVTNMSMMFNFCKGLFSLDLSSWDTSNVTDMSYMFQGSNIQTLNVTGWVVSNVSTMLNMFYNCSSLSSLVGINSWSDIKANLSQVFYGCSALTSLDLSNWDTTDVTNMNFMFFGCSNLTTLDLSSWDTRNVTNMSYMFYNCKALTSLDLSNFNTEKLTTTSMSRMFYSVPSNIDWNYDGTNYQNCNNLTESDTKFSGTFPWIKLPFYTIDYTTGTTLPTYPSWFDRVDNSTTRFKPTYVGNKYGLWSNMKMDDSLASAIFGVAPTNNMYAIISFVYETKAGSDKFAIFCNTTKQFNFMADETKDRYFIGSGGHWSTEAKSDPIYMDAGNLYYILCLYEKDGSEYYGYDGVLIRKIEFFLQQ